MIWSCLVWLQEDGLLSMFGLRVSVCYDFSCSLKTELLRLGNTFAHCAIQCPVKVKTASDKNGRLQLQSVMLTKVMISK